MYNGAGTGVLNTGVRVVRPYRSTINNSLPKNHYISMVLRDQLLSLALLYLLRLLET